MLKSTVDAGWRLPSAAPAGALEETEAIPDTSKLPHLLQRLEQLERQLTATLEAAGERQAARAADSPPAALSPSDHLPHEPADESELPTPIMTAAGISLVVVTFLVMALAFLQAQFSPAGDSDQGVRAAMDREVAQILNTDKLYASFRAYASATLQDTYAQQLTQALKTGDSAGAPALRSELDQALRTRAASQFFFPQRMLDRNGEFNRDRFLGEAWAAAEQQGDLDPKAHMDAALQSQQQVLSLAWLSLLAMVAVTFFGLIQYLHGHRVGVAGVFTFLGAVTVLLILAGLALRSR